jgi:methionine--tRNA ligase beta chain
MDAVAKLAEIRNAPKDGPPVYASSLAFQFERSGYFALDKDSKGMNQLIFNRVVTLRDTWGTPDQEKPLQRNRGGADKQQQQIAQNEPVEDVRRIEFRAASIIEANQHPEADSLLLLKVDCGDEDGPRTVVAGLAGKIPTQNLVGKKVVAVTNLKPAKMRGIESCAMLLAASSGEDGHERIELLSVPDSVLNGELISFDGKEPSIPDVMLKSKGALKAWDRVKDSLRTDTEGRAAFFENDNKHVMMTSQGPATAATLKNASIQ